MDHNPAIKLMLLKLIEIVQMTCRIDGFLNIYRYTSLAPEVKLASF
jgi:hypothetical protein